MPFSERHAALLAFFLIVKMDKTYAKHVCRLTQVYASFALAAKFYRQCKVPATAASRGEST